MLITGYCLLPTLSLRAYHPLPFSVALLLLSFFRVTRRNSETEPIAAIDENIIGPDFRLFADQDFLSWVDF